MDKQPVKINLATALDMTFGLLSAISVSGYANVRALADAMSNISQIMDAVKRTDEQNEEAKPHDADDGQGQDV